MSQVPDAYEQKIIVALDEIASKDRAEGGMSNDRWTHSIKEYLCQIGKDFGFRVSATGCRGADTPEWLFDLSWAEGKSDSFQSLELAMESEWSVQEDDLSRDFAKLLVAKSLHKLFVYQASSDTTVEAVANLLDSKIKAFKCTLPGERYLLAGFDWQQKKFMYSLISCGQLAAQP